MYAWVIKTIKKRPEPLFCTMQFLYFASRTSLKNPRYLTSFHSKVKWFVTKDEAEIYLMKKAQKIGPINGVCVTRRKLYLDSLGEYDYWRNRKALLA